MTHLDPSKSTPPTHQLHNNTIVRWVFLVMGFVFVGLGILGIILPGMPTTVFILLAGYCWAKSSKRFYEWLLRHRLFGKMLKNWEEKRAIPRSAKYLAWSMMAFSSALLYYKLPSDKLWMAVMVTCICLASAIWMARLPDA